MKVEAAEIREALASSIARHRVPGASVAVFSGGDLVTVAAGVANVTTGIEVTTDTLMHIGSITKVLNATLVLQLVDEQKVDLDAPVIRYVPELRLKDGEALRQLTVRMLLNHTSGIDGDLLPDQGHDEETIDKAIGRFAELGQKHRPAEQFSYCNPATVIAGYLAQRLTGRSWYRLMRERIFEPLQMEHAAALPEEALLHGASVGHYFNPAIHRSPVRTSFAFLPLSFSPAGTTLMMSAADLIAFARAHMSDGSGATGARILSERSARAMRTMTVDNRGKGYTYGDGMGLGWMVFENGLLNHGGGGPGISAALYAHPERKFAAAILTNAEHGWSVISDLMEPWLKAIGNVKPFGMADIPLPTGPVSIDANRYVGVYEDVLVRYRISRTDCGLGLSRQPRFSQYESVSTEPTAPARLLPLGHDQFLLQQDGNEASSTYDAAAAFRIFAFRDADAAGRMRFLGNILRLYPRVSDG